MDKQSKLELLELARKTIENILKGKDKPDPGDLKAKFSETRAVFVTLTLAGELRGCIGQIIAREELWKAVQSMSVSAAFHDPRFSALTLPELEEVIIEISILTPMKKVDSYEDIVLKRDGVMVRKGFNSGVYLPQVAEETDWDIDTFLGSLCAHKAGLNWTDYKADDVDVFTFQVEKFKETRR